jgi:glycosyltransferase involved in cell wall biosynthesis
MLKRALGSVADQSADARGRVELIVSDNSPGMSRTVAEQILASWPGPTRYFPNEPSIGPIPNFNQSMAAARGRFVLLLHDDDFLMPGAIAAILQAIDRAEGERALLFGVAIVDERERRRRAQAFRAVRRLSPEAALQRLLTDSSFVRIPAIVIRRDALDEIGLFDASLGEPTDLDLMVRVFARFGVRLEPATIAAYTVHVRAATTEMFHAETIAVLMSIFDRAKETEVLPDSVLVRCQTDWFHHFILGGAYRQLRAGNSRGAARVLELFRLPTVAALGPSRRWRPIRVLFGLIVKLPPRVAGEMMKLVGRASPERFLPSS